MVRALRNVGLVLLVPLGLLLLSLIPEPFLRARAKPPAQVKDVQTFLAWKPEPIRVVRLTLGSNVFWQALGPAGTLTPSGPSAYSFDSTGRFIGWTHDMGDVHHPRELFGPEVKRDLVTLDEWCAAIKIGKP